MKSLPRKRRTREHIIADLSVNHVERHVLLCGYVIERIRHDYGIDVAIYTFNKKGEVEDDRILVQLKATDQLRRRRGHHLACHSGRRHGAFHVAADHRQSGIDIIGAPIIGFIIHPSSWALGSSASPR